MFQSFIAWIVSIEKLDFLPYRSFHEITWNNSKFCNPILMKCFGTIQILQTDSFFEIKFFQTDLYSKMKLFRFLCLNSLIITTTFFSAIRFINGDGLASTDNLRACVRACVCTCDCVNVSMYVFFLHECLCVMVTLFYLIKNACDGWHFLTGDSLWQGICE